ncbi:tetratricopeptide repeat protein [Clostridium ihumii]|uniref:tetratricopeptide repeat protein n=1 Tax=Clostridium ihumii TaxID=1470356 RepID=UPI003D326D1E
MNIRLYAKKAIVIVLLIILVLIGIFFIKQRVDIKDKYIKKGEEYFYTLQLDDAIKTYETAEKKDKDNALWSAKISEVYVLKEEFDNADKYIDKALEKNDINGEAHAIILNNKFVMLKNKIASGAVSENEINEFVINSEEYLKKFPENKNMQEIMFSAYIINNNKEKAKKIIDDYNGKTAYDLCEKANMSFILGDLNNGLKLLNDAFKKDKNEIRVYEIVNDEYSRNKDVLNLILEALKSDEENSCYKMMLAKIYLNNNDLEKSYKLIESVENDKNFIIPEVLELNLEEIKGNKEKVNEICEKLLQKNPKSYVVNNLIASNYLKKNDIENASKYFKKSMNANNKYINNYITLAPSIWELKGEPDKALPYLYHSKYLEPYNSYVYVKSGEYSWYNLNNASYALDDLTFASIIDVNDIELKYKISKLYLENHNYEQAVKFLKECISKDSKNKEYFRTLGTTYIILNKNSEALNEINKAYQLDKNDILTINNLGCYYIIVQSDITKAKENFTKAFNLLKDTDDDYTRKTIKDNYNKIIRLKEQYDTGKENEVIKIPDFIMFY